MLIPTVHLFWKRYQTNLLSRLKVMGGITISGDGRHDSTGHCAKYCAYTIFCCTLPGIIHFALVQVCLNISLRLSCFMVLIEVYIHINLNAKGSIYVLTTEYLRWNNSSVCNVSNS